MSCSTFSNNHELKLHSYLDMHKYLADKMCRSRRMLNSVGSWEHMLTLDSKTELQLRFPKEMHKCEGKQT